MDIQELLVAFKGYGLQYIWTVISIALNLFAFTYWIRQKFFLENFLAGKWVGNIHSQSTNPTILECELYLALKTSNENSGALFYVQKNLRNGETIVKGVDKLDNYKVAGWFPCHRSLDAEFYRHIHHSSINKTSKTQNDPQHDEQDELQYRYTWECKILAVFRHPKMMVTIKSTDGVHYEGVFRKD